MMQIRKVLQQIYNDIRGATAVEFALIVPAFMLMLFGVFGFAQLFWIQSSVEEALIVAGRYSMINTSATHTQIITAAQNALPALNSSEVTFTVTSSTSGGVTYTTINGSCTSLWLSIIPALASFNVSETINAPVPVGR